MTGRVMRGVGLAAVAVICVACGGKRANTAPPVSAEDRAAVVAVVTELFDAMRAGDSSRVRAVFLPGATLVTSATGQRGQLIAQRGTVDDFTKSVGTPHAQVYDERIGTPVVQVSDGLAAVWVDYSFYVGPTFSHCGVDAMHLAKTTTGWKLVNLADTRRREGCVMPK
jgi:hypothetical protein